ncbi:MAG: WD40 repeat domain-containing serine/threonine-protein kinase [Gemmataceae bacterium]|nr:WD40 repeat domain-containing serine/threonine-protein kinase [Gemmataceae bacterium]
MTCPSDEELLAFHLGDLADARIAAVGEHLTNCLHCEQQARQYDSLNDTALLALRQSIDTGSRTQVFGADPPRASPTAAPDIPGYEVLGLVGRGGMGLVWKARHRRLDRLVALKCLRADSTASLERFQAEAQAVARLSHPNIVQIFEVGEWQGQPFLTLEFLDGGTLADHLAGKPQDVRASALLLQTLARAVHYAHTRRIVHRDLKPANILLQIADCRLQIESTQDMSPAEAKSAICDLQSAIPKVADFGIAKHLQVSGQTREGDICGTARYMAPEQAIGNTSAVGPGSDIYSLGVILYEMLTGRVPHHGATDLDTVLLVHAEEPVPPRRLQPGLPRDLDTICLKCLRKQPHARYASAAELADDLGRFLAGEPVRARPLGLWERGVKWVRRRPALAALLAVSFAAVLSLIAGTIVHNTRLSAALLDAQTNLEKARLAEEQARQAERETTRQLAMAHISDAQARRQSGLMGRRFKSLESLHHAAELLRALGLLDKQRTLELRNEAIACLALADLKPGKPWPRDRGWSRPCDFHPTLQCYAVHCAADDIPGQPNVHRGDLSVRRVADDQEVAFLPGFGIRAVAAEFSPDGRYLAAHYEWGQRHNYVWDLRSRTAILKMPQSSPSFPSFSPDSRRVAIARPDHSIRIHELPSGAIWKDVRPGLPVSSGCFYSVCFQPGGRRVAVLSGGTIQLRDVDSGTEVARFQHPDSVLRLAWRSDGKVFATGCIDHDIYLWDVANPAQPLRILKGHFGPVVNLAFSHGGDLLFSNSWDSTDRLWNATTGQFLLSRPGGVYHRHHFGPNDQMLADGWGLATGRECRTFVGQKSLSWVAISPKGRLMASVCADGVQLRDLEAAREGDKLLETLRVGSSLAVHFDPTGDSLITDSKWAGLQRWPIAADPHTGGLRIGPPQGLGIPAGSDPDFALSADGRLIAHSPQRGKIVLCDLRDPGRQLLIESPFMRAAALSRDGRWLATGNWQGRGVKVWDAQTGKLAQSLDLGQLTEGTAWPAFSPDGKWLVTGGFSEYCFWEVGSWQKKHVLPREHAGRAIGKIVFAPEGCGSMVAVLHSMTEVRLIDPETGREYARLPAAGTPYCFSTDGSRLVTSAGKDAFHVWDLRLIRRQLQEMDLDWDLPPFPPPSDHAQPLRVRVIHSAF